MVQPLILDGHLDVAMNALEWNRDQRRPVEEIRDRERELAVRADGPADRLQKGRGVNTVSLAEMRRGNVCLGFGTVNARIAHPSNGHVGYDGQELCYAAARGQLSYYELLESRGQLRLVRDRSDLRSHLDAWRDTDARGEGNRGEETTASQEDPSDRPPVGLVLAMEGADPIVDPDQVSEWADRGLRIVGLAHYGRSSYANGTGCEGGLTERGPALLSAMHEEGLILDLTHLTDQAFEEAIEAFPGPVLASHCNARALVPGGRQLSDEQLTAIIDRGGVIGVAMDAWMLQPDWEQGVYNEITVTLEDVVDHIDHVCSLAGNARHVAIGSDLDGGYGLEQVPRDLDTIADLQRIPALLRERGYEEAEIDRITHGNWIRLLEDAWDGRA